MNYMVNKDQAIIDFLITCPIIKNSSLYFNFINAKDNNNQIITMSNDKSLNRNFVDGSVLKRYSFILISFKSITENAIPKTAGMTDENVEDKMDVQSIIDWITEQNDLHNYPNFGEKCDIDGMEALTENPNLDGIDNTSSPALAKYSLSIRIEYLDKTKCVWNKD